MSKIIDELQNKINSIQEQCSHPYYTLVITKTELNYTCSLCDKIWVEKNPMPGNCSHPKECLTKTPKYITGNYDPTKYYYYYECYCELCNEYWTEGQ